METLSSQCIYLETKSVDDIKLGSLVELSRMMGLYAHWAVYVGHGDVIHISPPPFKSEAVEREYVNSIIASRCIDASRLQETSRILNVRFDIKVRRNRLVDVAAGSAIVVNNECDYEMSHYRRAEIVKRAESKLGTNDYNLLTWNCEHFATWCRYGKAVSKQVEEGLMHILCIDAFLVQLPSFIVIPPGTLPLNIIVADKIKDLLTNWANDRLKTISRLRALGENIKRQETHLKGGSKFIWAGAIACYVLAPVTFGATLAPAIALTGAGVFTSVQRNIINSRHMKDAQSALDADKKSFENLMERLKSAQQVPNDMLSREENGGLRSGKTRLSEIKPERVVAKSSVAAKLSRLETTSCFAGHSKHTTTFPLDIASVVTDVFTGNNQSLAADTVFELASELERDYHTIME